MQICTRMPDSEADTDRQNVDVFVRIQKALKCWTLSLMWHYSQAERILSLQTQLKRPDLLADKIRVTFNQQLCFALHRYIDLCILLEYFTM